MRVADYVVSFLVNLGVSDIFLVSGGGNMYLVDAVGRNKDIHYVCNHHEQACAMAVEGYARMRNDMGVAFVTSGPGGTNALTGLAGCWLDSIPALIVSGQVKTENTIIGQSGLRQFGDQELNIVDIVRPITKYVAMITDKTTVRYHLEKAVFMARTERPGPVWLDIPLDIQAAEIDPDDLLGFDIPEPQITDTLDEPIQELLTLLRESKRPILMVGNGIRLAHAEKELLELLELLQVPVVTAINGNDLVNDEYPYYSGRPGIMGQRGANFAVQNSDLLISVGSRLMLRQIGFDYASFARGAKKVVIDVDPAELGKRSLCPEIAIQADAKVFILRLIDALRMEDREQTLNIGEWQHRCQRWNRDYNGIEPVHENQDNYVNSYYFARILSSYLSEEDHVITSNGTANVSTMFAIKLKSGQRLFTNTALASMGYGLPAAIGACVANGRRQVICMENDGSLQMNIQELQTIVHYELPIKMFVFNNDGYLSIKATQSAYFPDNLTAADPSSGVSCPDLRKIADAYGISFYRIEQKNEIDHVLREVFAHQGAVICEIMMDPWQPLIPKVSSAKTADGRLVSKPLEDMFPFLSREEFYKNMDVEKLDDGFGK